jgi:hypothetical protein
MRRSFPQFVFAIVVLAILLPKAARQAPLAGIEETFITWLVANSNGDHSDAPVMLVEINDNSLVNNPLPWLPMNYALFLDATQQFKARVAAIEPVTTWDPETLRPADAMLYPVHLRYLHECILRTPLLDLGAQLGLPEDPDVLPALQPMPVFRNVTGAMEAVPDFTVVEREPGDDLRLTAALGFVNIPITEEMVEHAPMVFRYRGQLVPSFPLEAMMLYHGVTPGEVVVRLGSEIKLGNKLSIPINAAGAMRLDWKQPFDRAGFDDLELAANQLESEHTPIIDPAKLKDRLVVLARTDSGAQTLTLPTGRLGSAGEVFAEAIATAETGSFARAAGWEGSWLVLGLGVWLGWLLCHRRKLMAGPLVLAFLAVYLLLCLTVFETMRVALPLTPMVGLALFIGVFRVLGVESERVELAWVGKVTGVVKGWASKGSE